MASSLTAQGQLNLLDQYIAKTTHAKLVGTRSFISGISVETEAWESELKPIAFNLQAGEPTPITLQNDVVFDITYPSGTVGIEFNKVRLVNANNTKAFMESTIGDGSMYEYTGAGEFTLTDFDIAFIPTP